MWRWAQRDLKQPESTFPPHQGRQVKRFGADGKLIARFGSDVEPDSEELEKAIEKALK